MDEQVVAGRDTQADIAAFEARYPFPLDAFQREAITHLAQDRSVLVAAPTGTGKTLVAEYAIWRAQQRKQPVIHPTPLNPLSNPTYPHLLPPYSPHAVGLATCDIAH